MTKIQPQDITGGELSDYPNEKYRQFFARFPEIDTLSVSEWKPVHLLAYFTRKYREQYNTQYQFKFNAPSPVKCFEVFQVKKLAMLLSRDPTVLRDYIDWIFLKKAVKAKRRFTSISFLTQETHLREYKVTVLLATNNDNISRSTPLPEKYRTIFQEAGFSAQNYGDLALLSQVEQTPQLMDVFVRAQELGLDRSLLGKIV